MDYALHRRVQPDVERRPAVRAAAGDDGRSVLHGHVDARRRQRHGPQRARARAGPDSAAPADSAARAASMRSASTASRSITALTFKAERRLREQLRVQRQLHAVDVEGRRLEPGRRPSRRRTCRRTCATSSTRPASGRTRASTTGTSSSPAAPISCRSSAAPAASARRCWRLARERGLHRAVGRAVHGQPRRRPGEHRRRPGPASRSAAQIRTCRAASARPSGGSTPPRSRCRRRSRSAARRATASSARATPTWISRWRRPGGWARRQLEFRWEVFNLLNRANFDLPNRIFGTPNFGRIFSAKNPREMQFGVKFSF